MNIINKNSSRSSRGCGDWGKVSQGLCYGGFEDLESRKGGWILWGEKWGFFEIFQGILSLRGSKGVKFQEILQFLRIFLREEIFWFGCGKVER